MNRPTSYHSIGLLLALQLGIVAIVQAGRDGLWGKIMQMGSLVIRGRSGPAVNTGTNGEGTVGLMPTASPIAALTV